MIEPIAFLHLIRDLICFLAIKVPLNYSSFTTSVDKLDTPLQPVTEMRKLHNKTIYIFKAY